MKSSKGIVEETKEIIEETINRLFKEYPREYEYSWHVLPDKVKKELYDDKFEIYQEEMIDNDGEPTFELECATWDAMHEIESA